MVVYLIEMGAEYNTRDQTIISYGEVKEGDSPLIMACMGGHEDVARCLLQYGADVELKGPVNLLEIQFL